jgi:hypothetical protein
MKFVKQSQEGSGATSGAAMRCAERTQAPRCAGRTRSEICGTNPTWARPAEGGRMRIAKRGDAVIVAVPEKK